MEAAPAPDRPSGASMPSAPAPQLRPPAPRSARRFLVVGGVTASLGAALAACSTGRRSDPGERRGGPAGQPHPAPGHRRGVPADVVVGRPQRHRLLRDAARSRRAQRRRHGAHALRARPAPRARRRGSGEATVAVGGEAFEEPNPSVAETVVAPALEAIKDGGNDPLDVLRYANAFETLVALHAPGVLTGRHRPARPAGSWSGSSARTTGTPRSSSAASTASRPSAAESAQAAEAASGLGAARHRPGRHRQHCSRHGREHGRAAPGVSGPGGLRVAGRGRGGPRRRGPDVEQPRAQLVHLRVGHGGRVGQPAYTDGDDEWAGWPRLGIDRVEESRDSTGHGAGESQVGVT